MLSAVLPHVNPLRRHLNGSKCSLYYRLCFTYKGENCSVGGFTWIYIQQLNALYRTNGIGNRL
jgi:hypothetical protein